MVLFVDVAVAVLHHASGKYQRDRHDDEESCAWSSPHRRGEHVEVEREAEMRAYGLFAQEPVRFANDTDKRNLDARSLHGNGDPGLRRVNPSGLHAEVVAGKGDDGRVEEFCARDTRTANTGGPMPASGSQSGSLPSGRSARNANWTSRHPAVSLGQARTRSLHPDTSRRSFR